MTLTDVRAVNPAAACPNCGELGLFMRYRTSTGQAFVCYSCDKICFSYDTTRFSPLVDPDRFVTIWDDSFETILWTISIYSASANKLIWDAIEDITRPYL